MSTDYTSQFTLNVLILSDHTEVSLDLQRLFELLKKLKYNVKIVSSDEIALSILKSIPVNIFIVDIHMLQVKRKFFKNNILEDFNEWKNSKKSQQPDIDTITCGLHDVSVNSLGQRSLSMSSQSSVLPLDLSTQVSKPIRSQSKTCKRANSKHKDKKHPKRSKDVLISKPINDEMLVIGVLVTHRYIELVENAFNNGMHYYFGLISHNYKELKYLLTEKLSFTNDNASLIRIIDCSSLFDKFHNRKQSLQSLNEIDSLFSAKKSRVKANMYEQKDFVLEDVIENPRFSKKPLKIKKSMKFKALVSKLIGYLFHTT